MVRQGRLDTRVELAHDDITMNDSRRGEDSNLRSSRISGLAKARDVIGEIQNLLVGDRRDDVGH